MKKNNQKGLRKRNLFVGICCILVIALSLTGCEPLRKKFTRKKKAKQEDSEVLPVLEPVDYPKPVFSPEKTYQRHFSLVKVWYSDLLSELQENESQKRQLFLLDKITAQLNELKILVTEEKQSLFTELISEYENLRDDLAKTGFLRDTSRLKKQLEFLNKRLRNEFNLDAVKDFLVQ